MPCCKEEEAAGCFTPVYNVWWRASSSWVRAASTSGDVLAFARTGLRRELVRVSVWREILLARFPRPGVARCARLPVTTSQDACTAPFHHNNQLATHTTMHLACFLSEASSSQAAMTRPTNQPQTTNRKPPEAKGDAPLVSRRLASVR